MSQHGTFRVAAAGAGLAGFRDVRGNAERVGKAREALRFAALHGASLLVFPAGYLRARSEDDVAAAAKEVVAAARKAGLAVVVGVDADSGASLAGEKRDRLIAAGRLPCFVVAATPESARPAVWRQRSQTRGDAASVPEGTACAPRRLRAGGREVALFASGEVFSPAVRTGLAAFAPRTLVAVAAHEAAGVRHHHATKHFAAAGHPSLRAVHSLHGARNVLSLAGGGERAPVASALLGDGTPWVEVAVFEVA